MEQHHESTKQFLTRLPRAMGHVESGRHMVEEGRDCPEVLVQLAAVKSAINNTGKLILKDHIRHCVAEAMQNGDRDALDALSDAIDRFVK